MMRKTPAWFGFIILMFVLLLNGCSRPASTDDAAGRSETQQNTDRASGEASGEADHSRTAAQELRAMLPGKPDSLDPRKAVNRPALRLLNAVSEGLVRVQSEGAVQQGSGLAESWTVEDEGTRYVFRLRETRWSDGTPLTAGDFVRGWRKAVDPRLGSPYAHLFYIIRNGEAVHQSAAGASLDQAIEDFGVRALDSRTLEVILERPFEAFLQHLSQPAFFPDFPGEQEDGPELPQQIPAVGPYRFVDINEESYNLVKNEGYWDAGSVRIERLEFPVLEDWRLRLREFEDGEADWVDLPLTAVQTFKDKKLIRSETQGAVWYLVFNTSQPPVDDDRVRKALSFAIDRLAISEDVLRLGAVPATGLTPPRIASFVHENYAGQVSLIEERADPERARAYWQQAMQGLGSGASPKITLVGDPEMEELMRELAQQWRQNLDLNVEVLPEKVSSRLERAMRGNFQIMVDYWVADYNDPLTFLRLLVSHGVFNDSRWSSEEFDQLLVKGRVETDPASRTQAMIQAERMLIDPDRSGNLPLAPLYWPVSYFAVQPSVQGVLYLPVGPDVDFKFAYLSSS